MAPPRCSRIVGTERVSPWRGKALATVLPRGRSFLEPGPFALATRAPCYARTIPAVPDERKCENILRGTAKVGIRSRPRYSWWTVRTMDAGRTTDQVGRPDDRKCVRQRALWTDRAAVPLRIATMNVSWVCVPRERRAKKRFRHRGGGRPRHMLGATSRHGLGVGAEDTQGPTASRDAEGFMRNQSGGDPPRFGVARVTTPLTSLAPVLVLGGRHLVVQNNTGRLKSYVGGSAATGVGASRARPANAQVQAGGAPDPGPYQAPPEIPAGGTALEAMTELLGRAGELIGPPCGRVPPCPMHRVGGAPQPKAILGHTGPGYIAMWMLHLSV